MVSFWQLDVAFLYAYDLFKEETIEFFFKLFRFGSIMLTPTIFHIGYTIVQEMLPTELKKKWRFFVNRTTVLLFYGLAFLVYVSGWSHKGISGLELIQIGSSLFYFPVYGELSWIFNSNVILFIVSMTICLLISLQVQDKSIRSFLVYFSVFSSIGICNWRLKYVSIDKIVPKFDCIARLCAFHLNPFEPNASRNRKQYE